MLSTDVLGEAKWFYSGTDEGSDRVKACYINACDESSIEWQNPANIFLNPLSASCNVGEPHILRVTVKRWIKDMNEPLVNKTVTFKVVSGPNAGTVLPSNKTDETGDAFSRCVGNTTGTNEFEACITDNGDEIICARSSVQWGLNATSISRVRTRRSPPRHFLRSLV